jgi:hypothetical protein
MPPRNPHSIHTIASLVVIFLVFAGKPDAAFANLSPQKLETAFRFSIAVDAAPELVWPSLFKLDQWKYSVAKLEDRTLSGDQEGGVVAVYQDATSDEPGLLIKTLKIIPQQHYSFSIYTNEQQFVGFASYDLSRANGQTQLIYTVYLQGSAAGLKPAEVAARQRQIKADLETRQAKELAALKALVERTE